MYRDQSGEFVCGSWGLRDNDSNSCKLNLIKISLCGRCKKGRGGEGRGRKGRGIFPSLATPPPCFPPLLKSTIPFDTCHMLKSSPSKCLQPSLHCYKICQKYKTQQTSQIPFQRCHYQRHFIQMDM